MHDKISYLFLLLIAIVFLLKGLGVFDASFVDVSWPVLLGIIALLGMGNSK